VIDYKGVFPSPGREMQGPQRSPSTGKAFIGREGNKWVVKYYPSKKELCLLMRAKWDSIKIN